MSNFEKFEKWMEKNSKRSISTIKKYVAAIETISKELSDYYKKEIDIYKIEEAANIDEITDKYLKVDELRDKDVIGNRMYTSALKWYKKYLEDINIGKDLDENMEQEKKDSWSRINTEDKKFIGRKRMDFSAFKNGTTIPGRFHKGFLENLSEEIAKGSSVKVELEVEGKKYDATIRYPNFKDRKDTVIQINYGKKLSELLKRRLSTSYEYIMDHIDESGKKQIKTPEEYSEYMDFYKGDKLESFIVKLISKSPQEFDEEDTNDEIDEDEFNNYENIDNIIKGEDVDITLKYISSYILDQGYTYDEKLIKNFYISLKTKPFVILSGISGTGKSKIVELFANALGATSKNGRFNLIPVKPDWSDATDLLGYRNIESKFTPGIITRIAYEAMKNPELPYFICLDEMNLARVEYYFSDILSVMETRRKDEEGKIITNYLLSREQFGRDAAAESSYGDIYLPENLYIVGTVNMDETTFPFSKKVLDRANTIEFNMVDLRYDFDKVKDEGITNKESEIKIYHNDFLKSEFLQLAQCKEYKDIAYKVIDELIKINNVLEKYNYHFGYRVRDEIVFFMTYATRDKLMEFEEAFDLCIVQKILPKISGSSDEVLRTLMELFDKLNNTNILSKDYLTEKDIEEMKKNANANYKNVNSKIINMIRRFNRDGFTTFWQ